MRCFGSSGFALSPYLEIFLFSPICSLYINCTGRQVFVRDCIRNGRRDSAPPRRANARYCAFLLAAIGGRRSWSSLIVIPFDAAGVSSRYGLFPKLSRTTFTMILQHL